jgi:opacity protein-like surface antigen
MNLKKFIIATALSVSAISAFANWQPYISVDAALSQGTYANNINNPYQYSNDHIGTSNPKPPYNFKATVTQVLPGMRIGISNQYNKIYLGFEADIAYDHSTYTTNSIVENLTGPIVNSFQNNMSATLYWQGALVTQLGYFITQQLMPYARVGLAATQVTNHFTYVDLPGGTGGNPSAFDAMYANNRAWLFGPTVGLGAQYSLTPHIYALLLK